MRQAFIAASITCALAAPAQAAPQVGGRHAVTIAMPGSAAPPLERVGGDPRTAVRLALKSAMVLDFAPEATLSTAAPPTAVAPASSIAVPIWMRRDAVAPIALGIGAGCAIDYRPSGLLASAAERRREAYFTLMSGIACEYGIPTALFDALIIRESGYNPAIWSAKLAFGLTQLMPATAKSLGVDRYDIAQNLRGGARYLRQQLDRFGAWHLALAAYNAGPGRLRGGRVPRIAETQGYVSNVMTTWSRLTLPAGASVAIDATIPTKVSPRAVRIARF